jgi:hypothetical protein
MVARMYASGSLDRQVAWLRVHAERTLARNAELLQRNYEIRQATAKTIEEARAAQIKCRETRADSLRLKSVQIRHGVTPPPPAPLSLMTPPMLLELAAEFGELAARAATPESAAAFHDLMFRYTALAGGYDTSAARSQYCH